MRNVRATGPLWAVKTGYIVVSVLFCVLGVVLLVTQAEGQDMFPAVRMGICSSLPAPAPVGAGRPGAVPAGGGAAAGPRGRRGRRCGDAGGGRYAAVNGTLHAGEVLYPTYPAGGVTYPYTVPEGCLFILNDYRTRGRDSRHFGAVPQQDAAGKVITLLRRRGL